jgi:hypothetical protein
MRYLLEEVPMAANRSLRITGTDSDLSFVKILWRFRVENYGLRVKKGRVPGCISLSRVLFKRVSTIPA